MTKLFLFLVIALFVAEVILAITAIINIWKLDNEVNKLNDLISKKNPSVRCFFMDLRALMEDFSESVENFKKVIKEKKTLYLYNVLRTTIVYAGIFSLKGKYKKAAIGIQLAKEIYEGICEI
jgi:hypothetical protein